MDEEYRAISSTLSSFFNFHAWQDEVLLQPKAKKYASLPESQKALLDFYPTVMRDLGQCIQINQAFFQRLALCAAPEWGVDTAPLTWEQSLSAEYEKAGQTLLQLAREWSSEGAHERLQTYGPILKRACESFPENRSKVNVLVPGCGTGRLVYDFVRAGFCTQGNEASYHMLMALGFMLNHVTVAHGETIFPYLRLLSNKRRRLHQFRPVTVPDDCPMAAFADPAHNADLMSITAGSFSEVYAQAEFLASVDIVATSFFLDTALNIVDYLLSIRNCLKENALWINVGPLHWHEEETASGGLEVTQDELLELVKRMGFEIVESLSVQTTYAADAMATGRFTYDCGVWVARKKSL